MWRTACSARRRRRARPPRWSAAARWRRCSASSLFSPRLVRPLASVVGWPLERLRGLTGRLARENTVRKPGRTAVTAAALMIGLRAGRLRDRVRGRASGRRSATRSTTTSRATRPPEHRRLLADQPRRGAARRRGAGRQDGLVAALRAAAIVRAARTSACRRRPAHVSRRAVARLGEGLAEHALRRSATRGGDRRRLGEEATTSTWATGSRCARRSSAHVPLRGDGHGQGQRRPARQRWWSPSAAAPRRSASATPTLDVRQARSPAPTSTQVQDADRSGARRPTSRRSTRSTSRS